VKGKNFGKYAIGKPLTIASYLYVGTLFQRSDTIRIILSYVLHRIFPI